MNSQNSIDNFLQSVCRFISTEEKAIDIQDELKDHIYNYIEEYIEDGMNQDEATTMALKQMGDPNSLSKLYKDKLSKANRIIRVVSRLLLLFLYIISDFVYFSLGNYDNLQALCAAILTITIFYECGVEIIDFIRIHKKDKELSKEESLFYVQSYKQPIWDERILKYGEILILGICFILFVNTLGKFNNLNNNKEVLSSSLLSINIISIILLTFMNLSILNPKGKNTVIYSQGILMFSAFISWNNIQGYMWEKESINNKICYTLQFSLKKQSILKEKSTTSSERAPIKVSSSQVNLLNELFKAKNIEQINC